MTPPSIPKGTPIPDAIRYAFAPRFPGGFDGSGFFHPTIDREAARPDEEAGT